MRVAAPTCFSVAVGVAVGLAGVWPGSGASAQGMRGWIGSTVQAVELRPIEAIGDGCPPAGSCYLPLDEELSVAATQDVSLTAWGFGVEGMSATVLLRNRARLGSDAVWPRSDDRFDALLAYGQLVRSRFTLRLGRQEIRSGLGFPSFDGAMATWHLADHRLRLEGYGGRSLARGLREPARDALRGIEDFLPDQSVHLWGGAALTRLRGLALTARYQREILGDRSGLASERGSVDWTLLTRHGRVAGAIDYDFALDRAGKGRLSWSTPLEGGRWVLEAAAMRYVPYFSLSTIWGLFEPVAYHGVEGRVGWSPSATAGAWVTAGWRVYGDAEATSVLRPLEDRGRRLGLGGRWAPDPRVTLQGSYDLEWGPGGFLSSADASGRYALSDGAAVSASLTTFQQIEQFRLGDGRGYGGGVSFDARVSTRVQLAGGASLLRHSGGEDGTSRSPWNQSRGWTSLRVLVGDDPGLANRRRR